MSTHVALIAEKGMREPITAILERRGIAFASFDSVETMMNADIPARLSAIVLWLQDEIASVSGLVEPLAKRVDQAPVVVACPAIQRWEVRAALAAGAAGVIVEDDLDSGLGSCLDAVRSGQICVPREHWREIEPRALSSREKQVLGLVAMGCMNSQIAERLFLAESTVKSHLSSAFGKLGVRSRHEAAELVMDPERGLGAGILALDAELQETLAGGAR